LFAFAANSKVTEESLREKSEIQKKHSAKEEAREKSQSEGKSGWLKALEGFSAKDDSTCEEKGLWINKKKDQKKKKLPRSEKERRAEKATSRGRAKERGGSGSRMFLIGPGRNQRQRLRWLCLTSLDKDRTGVPSKRGRGTGI